MFVWFLAQWPRVTYYTALGPQCFPCKIRMVLSQHHRFTEIMYTKHLAFHLAHSNCFINAMHCQGWILTTVIRVSVHKLKRWKNKSGRKSDWVTEMPKWKKMISCVSWVVGTLKPAKALPHHLGFPALMKWWNTEYECWNTDPTRHRNFFS